MKTRKGPSAPESLKNHYTGYPLLNLQNKTGTLGCILKNTFYPPYKKPLLPFGGMSAKVHQLLRSLKIAHTSMAAEHIRLEENLPDGYQMGRVLYTVDKLYDYWMDPFDIGKSYCHDQVGKPFLAEGFVMERITPEWLHYSFDLTPFYSGCKYPEYSGYSEIDVSKIHIKPLKTAAAFYNECIDEFFIKGFLVFPLFYVDAMAAFYPPETIEGAVIVII